MFGFVFVSCLQMVMDKPTLLPDLSLSHVFSMIHSQGKLVWFQWGEFTPAEDSDPQLYLCNLNAAWTQFFHYKYLCIWFIAYSKFKLQHIKLFHTMGPNVDSLEN